MTDMKVFQEPVAATVPIDLDAIQGELVAVDNATSTVIALRQAPDLPVLPGELVRDNILPKQAWHEDPYVILTALKWGIPAGIVAVAVYGVAQIVLWINAHLADIGMGIGGVVGTIILLSLLGGGGAVCAGLHCAGCRR